MKMQDLDHTKLIALVGGIGSGKSVVSRILRVLGYDVYDCDSQAKILMSESDHIKRHIFEEIAENAVECCNRDWRTAKINKQVLSDIVFNDTEKLAILNRLVHKAVKLDIQQWHWNIKQHHKRIAFVETAILYTSGLDAIVDGIWYIKAPEELRILRVISRDTVPQHKIIERINSQKAEYMMLETAISNGKCIIIDNDNCHALLPQIMKLI